MAMIFHLRRDDAGARIGELGDGLAVLGAQRLALSGKFRRQPFAAGKAVVFRAHMPAVIGLDVAAGEYPVAPKLGKALLDADVGAVDRIGTGGIVDGDRRLARGRMHADLAHRHADIRMESRPECKSCGMPAAGRW